MDKAVNKLLAGSTPQGPHSTGRSIVDIPPELPMKTKKHNIMFKVKEFHEYHFPMVEVISISALIIVLLLVR
jgi:hypothetical protein